MSRHESDREDLMREATALAPRMELALPAPPEPLVAGWRRDGGLSLYFGADPVYHFDPDGRLRRAFAAGHLYRAQVTTLARLTRHRTPAATELRRHDLSPPELAEFLSAVRNRLDRLRDALTRNAIRVLRHIPEDADPPVSALQSALDRLLAAELRLAPVIKGKP